MLKRYQTTDPVLLLFLGWLLNLIWLILLVSINSVLSRYSIVCRYYVKSGKTMLKCDEDVIGIGITGIGADDTVIAVLFPSPHNK